MLCTNNRMSCVRTKEAVNWAPSKVYNVNEAFNSRNKMVFNFKWFVVNIQKDHVKSIYVRVHLYVSLKSQNLHKQASQSWSPTGAHYFFCCFL
jgi:hypothetical protein